eukprot:5360214-Alexandrium_andersonii.AAC.1
MSASLVGSEMCIRDSARWRRTFPAASGGGPPAFRGRGSADAGPAEVHDCLLYTSDAADDM